MKISSAKYVASGVDLDDCPNSDMAEFAFIGRSNVGKSSLINMLTNHRGLAMISSTPGKTRLINFFTINDSWSLVDLPGYGFAKVSRSRSDEFNYVVADYLSERENLKCIFVLIDSRHEPQSIDLEFLQWLKEYNIPVHLVFTKIDLSSYATMKENVERFTQEAIALGLEDFDVFKSSSKNRKGRDDILNAIQQLLPSSAPKKKTKKNKSKLSSGWLKKMGQAED